MISTVFTATDAEAITAEMVKSLKRQFPNVSAGHFGLFDERGEMIETEDGFDLAQTGPLHWDVYDSALEEDTAIAVVEWLNKTLIFHGAPMGA